MPASPAPCPNPAPASSREDGWSASKAWLRALEATGRLGETPERTLPVALQEIAAERGDAPALIFGDQRMSHAELAAAANRVSRWALGSGLRPGEVVALLMPNRPEYLAIWLGLSRVGVVVALINTHLGGPALAHVLTVAAARAVVADVALAGAARTALSAVGLDAPLWVWGEGDAALRLDHAAAALDGAPLAPGEAPRVTLSDPALLIYTSGTTGLPKAARVSHHRALRWSGWFAGMMGVTPDDRLYNCLPMYHSIGGVAACGAALLGGGSVVVRQRFSASRFWADVGEHDCTLFQYIGELCRYLINAPHRPEEIAHRLRLACGNGLRPDIWEAFQARFAIPRVLEFYASTEGSFSLFNAEGRVGAIGRAPPFLRHRSPVALVAHDAATGAPSRGAEGRCTAVAPGEVGEAIGRLGSPDPAQAFEGYTDPAASDAKVLRDVFRPGDRWMRTGDLMRQDAQGFYYFVDRVGDTFRWKGENVATTEVAEALASWPGVAEAIVYGVAAPGADGRAGMAALVLAPGAALDGVGAHLAERLPTYARPLVLRLTPALEATGTFKPQKAALAEEGFDPRRIADPLLFLDPATGGYVPLTPELYERIASGAMKL